MAVGLRRFLGQRQNDPCTTSSRIGRVAVKKTQSATVLISAFEEASLVVVFVSLSSELGAELLLVLKELLELSGAALVNVISTVLDKPRRPRSASRPSGLRAAPQDA